MNKQFRLRIASIFLLSFLVLTILVVKQPDWFQLLDQSLEWLPQLRTNFFDLLLANIALTATILPVTGVSLFIAFHLWRKKEGIWAIWVVGNLVFVSAIGQCAKWLIGRPRPVIEAGITRDSYSFPSGHTLLAVTLVLTVFLLARFLVKDSRKLVIAGIVFLSVIIFSRFYLGVHYPSDTLASICLASGLTLTTYDLTERQLRKKHTRITIEHRKIRLRRNTLLLFLIACLFAVSGGTVYALRIYLQAEKTVATMHAPIQGREATVIEELEPISFLVLGIANDSKRKTDYRANTIMVITLNPQTERTTITSIPRDAYVEIVGKGINDKINHAHSFGGAEMMIATVENYLQLPIHHYFSLNMDGMADLVDAIGGITVENQFEFTAEKIHYPEGRLNLNGWEALQYTRMRKDDPLGDYGRQRRQREVTEILAKELLSGSSVFHYQELMTIVGENGQTDLSFQQLSRLLMNYLPALTTIENYQIEGIGFTGDGIVGEYGISYQQITEEEQQQAMQRLHEELEIQPE
jgi:LCP family protein required for cell wall assembly